MDPNGNVSCHQVYLPLEKISIPPHKNKTKNPPAEKRYTNKSKMCFPGKKLFFKQFPRPSKHASFQNQRPYKFFPSNKVKNRKSSSQVPPEELIKYFPQKNPPWEVETSKTPKTPVPPRFFFGNLPPEKVKTSHPLPKNAPENSKTVGNKRGTVRAIGVIDAIGRIYKYARNYRLWYR